jgi:hypothetical protein
MWITTFGHQKSPTRLLLEKISNMNLLRHMHYIKFEIDENNLWIIPKTIIYLFLTYLSLFIID